MRQVHANHFALTSLAVVALAFSLGCNRTGQPGPQAATQATAQPAPPPTNDNQLSAEVQSQLHGDAALDSLPIQTQVINGVVTLSGTVNDEAARELAANDAAQVNGVRTVVNNLVVQQSQPPVAAESAASLQKKKDEEAARMRRQKREQARELRQQQQQQAAKEAQQAQNNPPSPPPPVATDTQSQMRQAVAPPPPPPPPPPPQPVTQTVTIPAGTDLAVRISENLETGKTQPGDIFHGALADNLIVNGQVAIRRGASVTGDVLDAKDATHFKGDSMLSLELQKIKTHSTVLTLATDPLVKEGKGRGKNTAKKAGGAALFGTILGALAGGGRGALLGAAAGGAAGAGVNAVTRGQQVIIPSESILHFKLSQPLKVTITTTPGSQPVTSYSNDGTPQLQQPN